MHDFKLKTIRILDDYQRNIITLEVMLWNGKRKKYNNLDSKVSITWYKGRNKQTNENFVNYVDTGVQEFVINVNTVNTDEQFKAPSDLVVSRDPFPQT